MKGGSWECLGVWVKLLGFAGIHFKDWKVASKNLSKNRLFITSLYFVKIQLDDILISGKSDEEHQKNLGSFLKINSDNRFLPYQNFDMSC